MFDEGYTTKPIENYKSKCARFENKTKEKIRMILVGIDKSDLKLIDKMRLLENIKRIINKD